LSTATGHATYLTFTVPGGCYTLIPLTASCICLCIFNVTGAIFMLAEFAVVAQTITTLAFTCACITRAATIAHSCVFSLVIDTRRCLAHPQLASFSVKRAITDAITGVLHRPTIE
jgi:hypothetical protein